MSDDTDLLHSVHEDIISVQNLLEAWKEFICGKRRKADVQEFQHQFMDNVLRLHADLTEGTYRHGSYHAFKISDPKPRDIHKATVRDRLLHHALYRVLYPLFDRTWIADSFSCRDGKGTHRAMLRYQQFARKVSLNHTRTCWVLKCDIRKFFANIDQTILLRIVRGHIKDEAAVSLIANIVTSFDSDKKGIGLPLGNLTSQMLVNVYMNKFDQYVKHGLRAKYYIRYADDFVLLSADRSELEHFLVRIRSFLGERLHLQLHPHKVHIQTAVSGVDFLGWVHFPDHSVLRTSTKRRMLQHLKNNATEGVKASYRGMLAHGNAHRLCATIL